MTGQPTPPPEQPKRPPFGGAGSREAVEQMLADLQKQLPFLANAQDRERVLRDAAERAEGMRARGRAPKPATDQRGDITTLLTEVATLFGGTLAAVSYVHRAWNKHAVPLGAPPLTYRQVYAIAAATTLLGRCWGLGADEARQQAERLRRAQARVREGGRS